MPKIFDTIYCQPPSLDWNLFNVLHFLQFIGHRTELTYNPFARKEAFYSIDTHARGVIYKLYLDAGQ